MGNTVTEFRNAAMQYTDAQYNLVKCCSEMIKDVLEKHPKCGVWPMYSVFVSTTNEQIIKVNLRDDASIEIVTEYGNYNNLHELDYETIYDIGIAVMNQYLSVEES